MIHRSNTSLQLITVNQADVEKMLDCYDSGMFDVSTSNAIAIALKRMLKPSQRVQVIRNPVSRECCIVIDDYRIELAQELFDWLEKAEQAARVKPISFWAALPNKQITAPTPARSQSSEASQSDDEEVHVSLVA